MIWLYVGLAYFLGGASLFGLVMYIVVRRDRPSVPPSPRGRARS